MTHIFENKPMMSYRDKDAGGDARSRGGKS